MKKLWYLCLLLLVTACKKDKVTPILGAQPEERIAEKLEQLESTLLSAPNGWKASLNTAAGGGYGFYVDFNEDETLDMLSDFNTETSQNLKSSTWRVKWGMDASLIFDTYNYITILQDPNPSVNGGTSGQGLQSDVEFEYVRIHQDSVILRGKRYKQLLTLVQLSEQEQQAYLSGQYTSDIAAANQYFEDNQNNYIEIQGLDDQVETVLSSKDKRSFVFQYIDENDEVHSFTYKYNYELGGIHFNEPIDIGGVSFIKGELNGDQFHFYDLKGNEYQVKQNPTPLTKLELLYSYNGAYRSILIYGESLPSGVDSKFNQVFLDMAARFRAASGRYLTSVAFSFQNSNTLKVDIRYNNSAGTSYLADAMFDYTYENGLLTLTNYTPAASNGNWNSRSSQIGAFADWIQSGPFRVDWVTSSDQNVSGLGGLYRIDDPTDFFYGTLE